MIDAYLDNWTLGALIFDDGQPCLQLDIGELIELDDSYQIEVIAEGKYYPITYNQVLNTIDKYMDAPLFAGFPARVKQKR